MTEHPAPYDIISELSEHLKLLKNSGVRFIETGKRPEKVVFVVDCAITDEYAGLISKIRAGMGFSESDVKILTIAEATAIDEALAARRGPKAVVAFGEGPLKKLKPGASLKDSRGIFLDLNGTKLMPTHPLSLLLAGDKAIKAEAWEDLKKVLAAIKE